MMIDEWVKMVEKQAQREREDIEWFKKRVRIRFIQQNNLLSVIGKVSTC